MSEEIPNKRGFEQLKVYQLSETLSDEVWKTVSKWDHFAKETVGKQLVRSADSIGANVAEGTGRFSYQDNRRFIRIARGSLYETRHWLRRAYCRGLLTESAIAVLSPLVAELGPRLNAYLNSVGLSGSSVLREDSPGEEHDFDDLPSSDWPLFDPDASDRWQ